jgi:hypothetical protein
VPSKTGSPVVFVKSASTIVSDSLRAFAPRSKTKGEPMARTTRTAAMAAPVTQERVEMLGLSPSARRPDMTSADEGRLAGLDDSARMMARSSTGLTSETSVDGAGYFPLAGLCGEIADDQLVQHEAECVKIRAV